MRLDYLLGLTLLLGFLLLLIQRSEASSRRVVAALVSVPGLLVIYLTLSCAIVKESCAAFLLSLLLNILFWILIGRYNPVSNSDEIKVLGPDD